MGYSGLVAPSSDEADVRMHIIHRLASSSCTHSALLKALPPRIADHPLKDSVLNEVSVFRKPTATQSGVFDLKPELLSEVNPFSCHLSRRDRQSVLERLHGAAHKAAAAATSGGKGGGSGGSDTGESTAMLATVTFPETPPCLRPLGDVLVCGALGKVLAAVLDTACSHLTSDDPAPASPPPGALTWVDDSCIQHTLHLIALAISAAEQDRETGSLGGRMWQRVAANFCADGVRCGYGYGSGGAIARRRSVVESLVLLQSPGKGGGGGVGGGSAQACRFQKEVHGEHIKAILRKLCESSAECKDKHDALLQVK